MNRCFSALTIVIILTLILNIANARAAESVETAIQFFEASKDGDVETMKRLIAGPFYLKRRALLERNKSYPEFLKKFYAGVTVKTLQYEIGNDDMIKRNHRDLYEKHYSTRNIDLNDNLQGGRNKSSVVIVELYFPDGTALNTKLLLKKKNKGIWKIYDEILITE